MWWFKRAIQDEKGGNGRSSLEVKGGVELRTRWMPYQKSIKVSSELLGPRHGDRAWDPGETLI